MTVLYIQHPLSAAFPPLTAEEFQGLKDSIENIGVQNPITLFEGMVIDGWHRYSAAMQLDMDCPSVELGNVDPRDFVLAQNKARRHVTQAQLAMATTSVYAWKPVGNPALSNSALSAELGKTTKELAVIAGTGVRSIEQAKTVQSKGAPEVQAAVKSGEIGLPKAAAIAKLPKEEQAEAIDKPLREIQKQDKPTPAALSAEPPAASEPPPPEYTDLDRANDQITDLQSALALANLGEVSDEDRQQAAELIAHLQAEVKGLTAHLHAVTSSRDFLMQENAQMKAQMAAQRKEIERLKASATA